MDLDRRKFFDYSVKAIAMTYLSMINLFPKVNLSEDKKKLPWKSKTFKFPLENFKLQSGEN